MVVDAVAPWAELVLFTADDLAALPDDFWEYELVEGRLVRMSPAGSAHGMIEMDLAVALAMFVRENQLGSVLPGDTGFVVSRPGRADTVLMPDIGFVSTERMAPEDLRRQSGFPRVAPDLVVEVASPSQHRPELTAKAKLWLKFGARIVWVIWPASTEVDVWKQTRPTTADTLTGSGELDGDDVLPGFTYPLSRLWG